MPASQLIRSALYIGLAVLVQAGCLLLFRLSQFGQTPFPQLPVAVLIFFGVLFVGLFMGIGQGLRPTLRYLSAGSSVLLTLVLSALFSNAAPGAQLYALAPITGITFGHLYPIVFKRHAPLIAAMTVYTVCTLLANYTFDSFLPLPGYGLVNVGTLFFGITFTQRDRVHQFGRGAAYVMIFVAAIANVATALSLGTPLRYVIVGFAAIILSEVADTEVYQRFIKRSWLTRVATSNAVSIPIDTVIFTVFAFYGAAWATRAWMTEVILTDIVVKLIVGFIAALGIVSLRGHLSPTAPAGYRAAPDT